MPPTSLPSFGLLIGPCLDIIWEYHSLLYEYFGFVIRLVYEYSALVHLYFNRVARNAALVMDELVCVAGYLYEVCT